jgi:hypothetical protein
MIAITLAGRSVQIIAELPAGSELENGHAIIGIFTDGDGRRTVETWSRSGRYLCDRKSLLDLAVRESQ